MFVLKKIGYTFLRSLSEAAAEGGSVAMAERIFANAYMVQGVGSKIIFCIVANVTANVRDDVAF